MARKSRKSSTAPKTFTSKGNAAPGTLGSAKVSPLGHFDTTRGQVYQHPRIPAEILGGSNVTVTNPAASLRKGQARTASLGMGGVGSVGRVRDVGAPAEEN